MKIQLYSLILTLLVCIPPFFGIRFGIPAHLTLLATFIVLAYNEIMPKHSDKYEKRIKDLETKVQSMKAVDSFRGARR